MMFSQTASGKAFEYALLIAAYERTGGGRGTGVLKRDGPYETARRFFELHPCRAREKYSKAAEAAVSHIAALEPMLEGHSGVDGRAVVSVQPDRAGVDGDIRDVLVARPQIGWEIGFSAKNQNSAVKHSRLSDRIDFGKKWFGAACSPQYMRAVRGIFGGLRGMIDERKRSGGRALQWSEVSEKEDAFYTPVLDAFEDEMKRLAQNEDGIPARLLEYLLGRKDFYKIMKYDKNVIIQGYNMNGTLGRRPGPAGAQAGVPTLKKPSRMVGMERTGQNRIAIIMNHGWQISLRIHNASSRAEPSLKFDVRLEGMPPDLYSHTEWW